MPESKRATLKGTSDRILEINLTLRDVSVVLVSDEDRKMYLGVKGLGLKLLYERLRPGTDALGEDNQLP